MALPPKDGPPFDLWSEVRKRTRRLRAIFDVPCAPTYSGDETPADRLLAEILWLIEMHEERLENRRGINPYGLWGELGPPIRAEFDGQAIEKLLAEVVDGRFKR